MKETTIKARPVTTDQRFDMFRRDADAALERGAAIGLDTEAVGPARRYTKARNDPFLNMGYAAIQGVSIGFENLHSYYFPLRHRGPNAKWSWVEKGLEMVRTLPTWAHNVKFDSSLLEKEGFDIEGIQWHDSMLAAWLYFSRSSGIGLKVLAEELLGRKSPEWNGSLVDKTAEQVKDYVCHDAINTLQVGEYLLQKLDDRRRKALVHIESPFAVELGRMERDGIRLDLDRLDNTMGALCRKNLHDKLVAWDRMFPEMKDEETGEVTKLSWSSTKDLQELFEEGSLLPYGQTKTGAYKTGKDVLVHTVNEGSTAQAEIAQLILDLRQASKVQGTYLDGFYEELRQWPDRKLHPELLQMGARTGRLAAANPNIMNQLSRGEYAPLLKACYVPEEGWVFISSDYAQIELRLFAELAGGDLLKAFLDGRDLHQEMGDAISSSRDDGKTFNFAFLIYGGGPRKAARQFGWTEEVAKDRLEAAHRRFPEAQAFRDKCIGITERRTPWPYVKTRTGRVRWVPELVPLRWSREDPQGYLKKAKYLHGKYNIPLDNQRRIDAAMRSAGERIAVNTIIQGSAADIAKQAMLDFAKVVPRKQGKLVTMVHDEILVTARNEGENPKRVAMTLVSKMKTAAQKLGYKVPIEAEYAIGDNWAEVH